MSRENDEFESVRQTPDPIDRARRAAELTVVYGQRSAELRRLRSEAIEEAKAAGMTQTRIAELLGISRGRVSQIKKAAPPRERVLFGVGPVHIDIPYRYATTDRTRPLIAAEDSETADSMDALARSLGFETRRGHVGPDTTRLGDGDRIVICGPKSSPVAEELMTRDLKCGMESREGRWWITTPDDSVGSPIDAGTEAADVAYLARHRFRDRTVVHIAGIHAIGSLGAAHYLTASLGDLFAQVGDASFSAVVLSNTSGMAITRSALLAGPYMWSRSYEDAL